MRTAPGRRVGRLRWIESVRGRRGWSSESAGTATTPSSGDVSPIWNWTSSAGVGRSVRKNPPATGDSPTRRRSRRTRIASSRRPRPIDPVHVPAVDPDVEVGEGLQRGVHDDQLATVPDGLDLEHPPFEFGRVSAGAGGIVDATAAGRRPVAHNRREDHEVESTPSVDRTSRSAGWVGVRVHADHGIGSGGGTRLLGSGDERRTQARWRPQSTLDRSIEEIAASRGSILGSPRYGRASTHRSYGGPRRVFRRGDALVARSHGCPFCVTEPCSIGRS